MIRQCLLDRTNHLWVGPGTLRMHNKLTFIQRIGEAAEHLITLAALIHLIPIELHRRSPFQKYTEECFVVNIFPDS
ncbi:MAG TPA: hypothetical protein VFV38_39190 [Ktedonobacteraceae bacterium]|nr:hypothetical protein [Ktedonobacteraceae bacterium]